MIFARVCQKCHPLVFRGFRNSMNIWGLSGTVVPSEPLGKTVKPPVMYSLSVFGGILLWSFVVFGEPPGI